MVVSFEVIPDGTTDLAAQLDYLKRKVSTKISLREHLHPKFMLTWVLASRRSNVSFWFFQIAMEDFSIEFEDYEYWAIPDEIFLDQIHDNLLDLYGSSTYDDETEDEGSGGIAGIVVGSVLAGIFVCVAIGAVIFVSGWSVSFYPSRMWLFNWSRKNKSFLLLQNIETLEWRQFRQVFSAWFTEMTPW